MKVETENSNNNSKSIHENIRDACGKKSNLCSGYIKSKSGKVLFEKEDIKNRDGKSTQLNFTLMKGLEITSFMNILKVPQYLKRK